MKTVVGVGLPLVALMLPALAYAGLNMKPGLWESTTSVQGHTIATDHKCYLQKDVDGLEKFQEGAVPAPHAPCTASGYKASGNTVTYSLTCIFNGQPSNSAVTSVFEGDHTSGTIKGPDGIVNTIASKRIGACSQSSFDN